MGKNSKMALKIVLVALYASLSGINLTGLKHDSWTCMENCISYQIWLTVVVILAYNMFDIACKFFSLHQGLNQCKENMSKLKIK